MILSPVSIPSIPSSSLLPSAAACCMGGWVCVENAAKYSVKPLNKGHTADTKVFSIHLVGGCVEKTV